MRMGELKRVNLVEPLEPPLGKAERIEPKPQPTFPPEVEHEPEKDSSGVGSDAIALECLPEKKQYKNRYKCLYGNNNCGENAVYCEPCNRRYEHFLWIINDDR